MCPNCGSKDMWDDNAHGGCNSCGWSSVPMLNRTRTVSNPFDSYEVANRPRDYDRWRAEEERRHRAPVRERDPREALDDD